MRAFSQSFQSGEAKNKEDYSLWRVGQWNDASAELEACVPEKVITGFEVKLESVG